MSEVPLYTKNPAPPRTQGARCRVQVASSRECDVRKVDVRLPGKGDSTPHGARPVHLIITMIKWIQDSRL